MKPRCRFAPSPTGHLHIGSARTALINWLLARHAGGELVLRIEDTDRERSKDEFTDAILDGLAWLGLDWDGEPVFQSRRTELYSREVKRLLEEGKAYHCSCSLEELDRMRKQAMAEGKKPKYDGRCRKREDHPSDRAKVVRFKSPQDGETVVDDLIVGRVAFDNSELDDLIIERSDGSPTYNFCVVVDDHDLAISHVIRGADHLNNTPRQIQLYNALGYELPRFGHHPLILGQDKSKLSKRHGATSLVAYREMGYLPEAMMNFLARIGWSHGDQEIFSREELIDLFTIEALGKSPGIWNPEKLLWTNSQYVMGKKPDELAPLVLPFLKEKGFDAEPGPFLDRIIELHNERVNTLADFAKSAYYYFVDEVEFDDKPRKKFLKPANREILERARDKLAGLDDFTEPALESALTSLMEELGVKLGKVAQPLRVAVTGGAASPGIFEVLALVGKERTLRRLDRAIAECGE